SAKYAPLTVTTMLPSAAPRMVPAAPSVESRTADATAARAPPTVLVQSISTRATPPSMAPSDLGEVVGNGPRRRTGLLQLRWAGREGSEGRRSHPEVAIASEVLPPSS